MDIDLLRIGTRNSPLALYQAERIRALLQERWPDLSTSLVPMTSLGDQHLDVPISQLEGKLGSGTYGVFVKELEMTLQQGCIDIAVHSLKDMPSILPEGLTVLAVDSREDVRDCLLTAPKHGQHSFWELPAGAVVGTSAQRRLAQLQTLRPDLTYRSIRGNLQTRLKKLNLGEYDAIVLATAGVKRLGWQQEIVHYFDPKTELVPAVGQGVLGVEFQSTATTVETFLNPLVQPQVTFCVQLERAIMKTLEGGCQLPLGVYTEPTETGVNCLIKLLTPSGSQAVTHEATLLWKEDPVAVGNTLGQWVLDHGGAAIRNDIRNGRAD